MTTGYLVSRQCFAAQSDAADAYFSAVPVVNVAGSTAYVNYFTKTGGQWSMSSYSSFNGGSWVFQGSHVAVIPTFASCEVEQQFIDGMTVGWGIALAMIIAYGYRLMREQTK